MMMRYAISLAKDYICCILVNVLPVQMVVVGYSA